MAFDVSNLYRKSGPRRRSIAYNAQTVDQIRDNMLSVTAHGFREEMAAEQYADEQERLDAVHAVEVELNRNLTELQNEKKARALNLQDDPSIFSDPDEPSMLSQEEANAYNRAAVKEFMRTTPEYHADNEGRNLSVIHDYLRRNGHDVIVSARKLKQVFTHLSSLGLLIERPTPVAASAPVQHVVSAAPVRPTVWDVDQYPYFQDPGGKASDMITGWDPNGSGARVTLSRLAVEKLSIDDFKRFSRVTVQDTPDWARVEARERMASQFSQLGGRER